MNISTPISTLFNTSESNAELIKEHSNSLEGRPDSFIPYLNVETFHCDNIQPIHPLDNKDFDFIKKIINKCKNLKIISFHCAYRSKNVFLKDGIAHTHGYLYSEQEMKDNMSKNIPKIKNIVGDIEILIENNNYYPTNAYDIVTDAKFISDLVYDNNIGFLFDQAHAQITAHNKILKYDEYISNLPLDKCRQIHLCKMGYSHEWSKELGYLAKDLHICPDIFDLKNITPIIVDNSVEYITIEFYKNIKELINFIKLFKKTFNID